MFLIKYLPNFIFHTVFTLSLLVVIILLIIDNIPFLSKLVFSKIPTFDLYTKFAKIIFGTLLVLFSYFEGGIAKQEDYENKLKELQLQIEAKEKESQDINKRVYNNLHNKVEKVKEKQRVITKTIIKTIKKYDKVCPVPRDVVRVLNDSTTETAISRNSENFDGGTKTSEKDTD